MALDIYLSATTSPHRNGQLFHAAVRKIHHNHGGILHVVDNANYEFSGPEILPSDVSLVFDAPAPKGADDGD